MNVKIERSWYNHLSTEFEKPYFTHLVQAIKNEYLYHSPIYPKGKDIFKALDMLPFNNVRVVILGQDPYHGEGQAEGLAFSVPTGVAVPPSLVNIKKEILSDIGAPSIITDGHLMPWVKQGVLLLNTTLTVRAGSPMSHREIGWELFTDAIIERLNEERQHLVFMLWGSHARRKCTSINRNRHLVLEAAHPSPLSAYRGFFGCRHFSRTNTYLVSHDGIPIKW